MKGLNRVDSLTWGLWQFVYLVTEEPKFIPIHIFSLKPKEALKDSGPLSNVHDVYKQWLLGGRRNILLGRTAVVTGWVSLFSTRVPGEGLLEAVYFKECLNYLLLIKYHLKKETNIWVLKGAWQFSQRSSTQHTQAEPLNKSGVFLNLLFTLCLRRTRSSEDVLISQGLPLKLPFCPLLTT